MSAVFICLSDSMKTAIGGGFTRDPSAKWTKIHKGATDGSQLILTVDIAADVFANRMARRAFGANGDAAWGAAKDGTAGEAQVYTATIGDGRRFTSVRFAVLQRL